jgi:hypothetical protein
MEKLLLIGQTATLASDMELETLEVSDIAMAMSKVEGMFTVEPDSAEKSLSQKGESELLLELLDKWEEPDDYNKKNVSELKFGASTSTR